MLSPFKKNFSFLIILPFLQMSCSTPKALEYRSFKNFNIEKLGFATSALKIDLVYFNPNSFGLQLKHTELDIFLNNNYLGHTVQDQLISIPSMAEFGVPIKIDVDMKNLLKNGFNTLLSSELMVKVTGTIKIGKGNTFINFPVNYEGMQKFSMF